MTTEDKYKEVATDIYGKPKTQARIEDWYVGNDDLIYGKVFGHPRFEDGSEIRTSRVVHFDRATGKAETLNTHYELGVPYVVKAVAVNDDKTREELA